MLQPATFDHPPTLDDIAKIAEEAFEEIPENLRKYVDGVAIRVDDFPDDETLHHFGIHSRFGLLGLYRGVDISRRSALSIRQDVDMIFLYRSPILAEWRSSNSSLRDVVKHVLIHEIGHHFGLSDDDMHRIEDQPG